MIAIPTDRNWTADEIEAFRPIVEGWTYDDVEAFYDKIQPSQMENLTAFHKVYKARIKEILLATPYNRFLVKAE